MHVYCFVYMTQTGDRWQAFINTLWNYAFHKILRSYWLTKGLLAS
jgi:hypothetical protein